VYLGLLAAVHGILADFTIILFRLLFWWLLASAMGSVYIFFSFFDLERFLFDFSWDFICFTSFTIIPRYFFLIAFFFSPFFFTPFLFCFVRRFVLYGWSALFILLPLLFFCFVLLLVREGVLCMYRFFFSLKITESWTNHHDRCVVMDGMVALGDIHGFFSYLRGFSFFFWALLECGLGTMR
jgi:hypothetical protein